jgi:predicted nucleotidyltransferase component of viral defense system
MSNTPGPNIAASIRHRLLNNSKQTDRPFQEVLQYFAMERFLYRLSRSAHAATFVLKGGLMLRVWGGPSSRPTKDIDFLAHMPNSVEDVVVVMREVCRQEVEPDGLDFDADGLTGSRIKEDADYEGVRVLFRATLENARIPMQLDVGFGDVMTPEPQPMAYPTILNLPAPLLHGYSRETTIAEKFEAMAKLGLLNSRMKDFFDVWTFARQHEFDGALLASAVTRTFEHRRTPITSTPTALTQAFAADPGKSTQWQGFLRKLRVSTAPQDLSQVITDLAGFLGPVAKALETGERFDHTWSPPGPWRSMQS